ncbi:MAG: hypothetical protein ACK4G3_00615 [bacterium]
MRKWAIIFVCALAGCSLLYKLKAKKWGDEITKAMQIVKEVASQVEANPMSVMEPATKSQYLSRLREAQTILQAVSDQVKASPASGALREAWENLDRGLDDVIKGVQLFSSAINLADVEKGRQAREAIQSGSAKLEKAKNLFLGK